MVFCEIMTECEKKVIENYRKKKMSERHPLYFTISQLQDLYSSLSITCDVLKSLNNLEDLNRMSNMRDYIVRAFMRYAKL